ncbi:MAG: STAS domain-containing protein [Pseudomonadota bacterium]
MPVQLNEQFEVLGDELTMQQAEAIKMAGYTLLERSEQSPVRIDFVQLERANSVTVAVMLAWHRHATLRKKAVEFTNLSAELGNIIEFSGLRELLLADHTAQP